MADTKQVISVDFTGVESGGGAAMVHIPEGDYGLKVVKAELKKGKDSKEPYIKFSMKVTKGHSKGVGKIISHTCSLTKQSLWNLRNLMEAAGKQVPSKAVKIPLEKMVGYEMAGTVIDDEPYNGKVKSIISAFFPLADLSAPSKASNDVEEEAEGETTEAAEETADEETEELFG